MRFFPKFILVLVVLAVIAFLVITQVNYFGHGGIGNILDGPGMIYDPFEGGVDEVRYRLGGGENGGSHSYTLTRNDDGTVTFEAYDREYWYSPGETRTYVVDADVLSEIAHIASEHCLQGVGDRDEGWYVLDGDMWSLTLECANGVWITLEEHQGFSDFEHEGIWAIVDKMAALDTGEGAVVERDPMKIGIEDLEEDRTLFYVVDDSEIGEAFNNWCLGPYELVDGRVPGEKMLMGEEELWGLEGNKADGSLASLVYDPEADALFLLAEDSEVTDGMLLIAKPEDPDDAEFYAEIIAAAENGEIHIWNN